ncbi:hypothetical protein SPONN_2156 [uncultured Candidatus Thioglobus sp.]|nr:hypothetical protein SPONN_2156 [uncultured Candidatus Thioglobus sp.]
MKFLTMVLFAFLTTSCFSISSAEDDYTTELTNNSDESVCGSFAEPFMFLLFRSSAGAAQNVDKFIAKTKKQTNLNVEKANKIKINDGYLRGYKLSSSKKNNGYLLVVQGNAMLADHILTDFEKYAKAGYDVYIYDFRDYGLSDGDSRLQSIVADYKKMITDLNQQYKGKQHLLYGMSFGGIVLLKALKDKNIDKDIKVVIDSVPSEIPFDCNSEYDPVNNLPPKNSNNFMFFVGKKDSIVESDTGFIGKLKKLNIEIIENNVCGHPYEFDSCNRFDIIEKYLIKE